MRQERVAWLLFMFRARTFVVDMPFIAPVGCRIGRPDAEGADVAGSLGREGEGHRSSRTQVLGVDRRLDRVVALHLPADVDHETGIRRVRPIDRAQEVLLILTLQVVIVYIDISLNSPRNIKARQKN